MEKQLFHLGVKMIIQNSQGKVLILKPKGHDKWDLPGGKIQHGESVLEALQGKIEEETGLSKLTNILPQKMILPQGTFATHLKVKVPLEGTPDDGLITWLHTCSLLEDQPVVLGPDYQEFQWVSWRQARNLLDIDCAGVSLNLVEEEAHAIPA
ncbi:MAG: NUDIX domain-containing protein [Alphaproteobacteria bacterium]|nr:NUDIX domain-containing protein [Alphaproteobacteria bacterium]